MKCSRGHRLAWPPARPRPFCALCGGRRNYLQLQMAWGLTKTVYLMETDMNEMDCVETQQILKDQAILLHCPMNINSQSQQCKEQNMSEVTLTVNLVPDSCGLDGRRNRFIQHFISVFREEMWLHKWTRKMLLPVQLFMVQRVHVQLLLADGTGINFPSPHLSNKTPKSLSIEMSWALSGLQIHFISLVSLYAVNRQRKVQ